MPIETPPSRQVGPVREIELRGGLLAGSEHGPVMVEILGTDRVALPVFSTLEKLTAFLDGESVVTKVQVIDDDDEFLASVPLDVDVIYDPWVTLEGKVRFTLVIR